MKIICKYSNVVIIRHPLKGFCVLANTFFKKGGVIGETPVVSIEFDALNKKSTFNDYPMAWDDKNDVIALGFVNLLNHAEKSNVKLIRYKSKMKMRAIAKRDIETGEELTIHYKCPLWFKPI
jgi:hypothetical protein